MYTEDDSNLRKMYQQVNEGIVDRLQGGRQFLKQALYKPLSYVSGTAERKLNNIKYANIWVDYMKQSAADQGQSFYKLSPDWVDDWMKDYLRFRPSEYNIHYREGENHSDYIRRAVAAQKLAGMRQRVNKPQPTPKDETSPVTQEPEPPKENQPKTQSSNEDASKTDASVLDLGANVGDDLLASIEGSEAGVKGSEAGVKGSEAGVKGSETIDALKAELELLRREKEVREREVRERKKSKEKAVVITAFSLLLICFFLE